MERTILFEWNPWWEGKFEEKFIERAITKNIEKWLKRKEINAFVGVRRSGKTTLMKIVIKNLLVNTDPKNIFFVKCDDERVEKVNLVQNALDEYYKLFNPKGNIYLFLDEVQEIPEWQKSLKRIYDLEKNIKIFISGSNFSLLKEDLTSMLAGRIAYFSVYPFDFSEFLVSQGIEIKDKFSLISKKKEILYYLEKYLELGGFPEVCLEKNEGLKRQLLRFYYDSIVYRDIVKRREIRNVSKMEKMINFLLANMGNPVNFHNMSKLVGLSTDTVVEYVKYMEDAFFIFPVPVFSYSIKSQEISPKKVYCIDTGIRSTVGFKFSEDYGRTVENIVFVELKRRFSSNPLVSIFYWKSKKAEVDFVIKNGLKIKELIQVCWNVEDKKTKEREVESLVEAMKEFKLKEGLVITEDYENLEVVDKKKIRFVPLWKWLLT